jgi:hypothetical protein
LFAAAGVLWGLAFFLDGERLWAAIACFALAALAKETAIVTPAALAGWEIWLGLRGRDAKRFRSAGWLATAALPLAFWYVYHWHRTGFVFGNPQYLRYNATANLTPLRMAAALWHRTNQVTLHMNLFVPVLMALACLLLDRLPEREDVRRSSVYREVLLVVIVTNVVFFSVLGGALLTRYLLPLYPLVILLCVMTFWARLRRWGWFVVLSGAAFVAALFVNPPYRFAPEDNLAYSDSIRLQQDAIAQIVAHYPHETVLTAWPASDALTKPELGYVADPVSVSSIDDFSFGQIQAVAQSDRAYTVGLIFSTKYAPPRWNLIPWHRNEDLDARFFGFHYDLSPAVVARLLGGKVVWSERRKGQWAAVLQFDRPQEARLALPRGRLR